MYTKDFKTGNKQYLYTNVHNKSIIHNSYNVQATKVSTNKCKQNYVYYISKM